MKDEETLGLNWDEVQMTLEAHLPSVLAHLRSLQDKQLPALEAALKTPEAAEKLLQAIQASQALFIKEEEDRVAAEAAALLKTRAGKKMQQLENEKRRAEAKRLAEANGGKKNKGMIAEEDDETVEKKVGGGVTLCLAGLACGCAPWPVLCATRSLLLPSPCAPVSAFHYSVMVDLHVLICDKGTSGSRHAARVG